MRHQGITQGDMDSIIAMDKITVMGNITRIDTITTINLIMATAINATTAAEATDMDATTAIDDIDFRRNKGDIKFTFSSATVSSLGQEASH